MNHEAQCPADGRIDRLMQAGADQEPAPIRIGHCKIHGPHSEAEAIAVAYAQRADVLDQIQRAERNVEALRDENQRLHYHIHRLNRVVRAATEL